MDKIPFGYMEQDGEIVPHPIDSQYVKFMAEKYVSYNDNPPAELVQQTIESIFEQEGKRLSYEEAAKIVPSSLIDNYILTEINMKKRLFDEFGDNNPEELKKILEKDIEQTRKDFANIPSEDDGIDESPTTLTM